MAYDGNHGMLRLPHLVLYGHPYSHLVSTRNIVNVPQAQFGGLALAACSGFWRTLGAASPAVLLLGYSAIEKRRGRPRAYAFGHGAWHVASAGVAWRLMSSA